MKKQVYIVLFCCLYLVACGGGKMVKPSPTPPSAASKPATPSATNTPTTSSKPGGYYLDDGPGDNPPKDIDSIPNAIPKKEPLLERANKPYKALDAIYTPMTDYQPYKETGVASWYGKRYHGKNTSSGEVYDMYSMTAAHTTLPLPSYVKVTNPANGRWVIVRVNDRGPFKSSRIIDLSYAAAYKLRFSSAGSTLVEVEAIDPNNAASYTPSTVSPTSANIETTNPVSATLTAAVPTTAQPSTGNPAITQYFVQAGAFKSEANAEALGKKIQSMELAQNVGMNKVYNGNLYRLKLGPFDSRKAADEAAANIRLRLNISSIIVNQ